MYEHVATIHNRRATRHGGADEGVSTQYLMYIYVCRYKHMYVCMYPCMCACTWRSDV